MRLSYGPFERVGSQVAIKRTRLQFLWTAKSRKPEITIDLYNTCYPLYQEFLTVQDKLSQRSYDVVGGSPGWNSVISSKESKQLLLRLKDWSQNHDLIAEWPIRAAITAMKAWSSDDEALRSLSWCKEPEIIKFLLFPQFYPDVHFLAEQLRELRCLVHHLGIVDFAPDEELFLMQSNAGQTSIGGLTISRDNLGRSVFDPPTGLPYWFFTSMSKDEYLADIERRAKDALETTAPLSCVGRSHRNRWVGEVTRQAASYCNRIEAYLSTQKEWKRGKVFVDHRAHMRRVDWAVRFQIEGKSYTDIAKEMELEIKEKPHISTVKRGVAEILDIIALDFDRRREVKPGPRLGSVHSVASDVSAGILRKLGHEYQH